MKKKLQYFFALLFFLFVGFVQIVKANHLYGGELSYRYISSAGNDHTYSIYFRLFADCGAAAQGAFDALPLATPLITIYKDGNRFFTSRRLQISSALSNIEITPLCPKDRNSTSCTNLSNPIPGAKQFVYTGTVILHGTSDKWVFASEGDLGASTLSGRSQTINNIDVNNSIMYLEATLNNTMSQNSSPVFTSVPTPFFCIGLPQQYNIGAIDPDIDSLSYSLIPAKINATANAAYTAGYTHEMPLPVAPGVQSFDIYTGQLSFTPNAVARCVVVNRVAEYRNGMEIGSSMREMTFVIIPTCNNETPTISTTEARICQGSIDSLVAVINTSDPDTNNIIVSCTGLPAGAILTVMGDSTRNPQLRLSWDVSNIRPGNYTFFITLRDDGCPLASSQTIAYTIRIEPFPSTFNTGTHSPCRYMNNGMAWVIPDAADTNAYDYTWTDTTGNILRQTFATMEPDTFYPLPLGTYNLLIRAANGCFTNYKFQVSPPDYRAAITLDVEDSILCQDELTTLKNTSFGDFISWQWHFGDGNSATAQEPTHSYKHEGTYQIRLIGLTDYGCLDTAYSSVLVDSVIFTVVPDQLICQGATTALQTEGGVSYSWEPTTGLSCPNCPYTPATPSETTTYKVTITNKNGCSAIGTTTINVVPMNAKAQPADTSICPGDSAHLQITGALSSIWRPAYYISDTTSADPIAYPNSNFTYTVYNTYEEGCKDSLTVTVNVYPTALLSLPDSVLLYPGDAYQLDPGGNCLYFQWFPPFGLSADNIANPTATPDVNTRYLVTAATENGCASNDSIDINVSYDSYISVPNAFTPGSAPNSIIHIINRGSVTLKHFIIFNRWGQKVFETNNITEGWDGTLNTHPQPMGAYIYTIDAYTPNGRKISKQGNITLLR